MSQQENLLRIEGVVRASSYARDAPGKQFLGAIIEGSDGNDWVIDYDEQSPFHAFADRQVLVSGEPYEPNGQKLIGRWGKLGIGHLQVATMRLVEVTPDAQLVEVGARHKLSGRFERGTSDTRESSLSLVTEKGDTFLVSNDPAGAAIGRSVEVWAYPVQPSPSIPRPPGQYLWIILRLTPMPMQAPDIAAGLLKVRLQMTRGAETRVTPDDFQFLATTARKASSNSNWTTARRSRSTMTVSSSTTGKATAWRSRAMAGQSVSRRKRKSGLRRLRSPLTHRERLT